eukprot:TRINITY_DN10116_c0_g1_i2.p1 TRINITY_DN10116_c0_g1~~TRINITY_DN10116_c0_g1_i2.p1  ORF type:complete len:446 (-),score=78.61 TRINITY_DN10116_c0_g1_i2:65-1357(-)
MVFIHGGAFVAGSGGEGMGCPLLNAQKLAAETGAIIVEANYRLGIFGFFSHPELLKESGTTGNYAIQDQRAALEWVSRNIASFGGDPGRITLAGESAGALSVLHHLTSTKSAHLFSRAITMSAYLKMWPLEEAYALGQEFLSHLKCDKATSPLQCVRNVSHQQLLSVQAKVVLSDDHDVFSRMVTFGPVSDGFELPLNTSLEEVFTKVRPRKPLLVGTTQNETNLWYCGPKGAPEGMSWSQASSWLRNQLSEAHHSSAALTEKKMDKYLGAYKAFPSPTVGVRAASTDVMFNCLARRMANMVSKTGAPVFRYVFAQTPAFLSSIHCEGAVHTSGMYFLFTGFFPERIERFMVGGDAGENISKAMSSSWGRFVNGEDPWTAWSDKEPLLQFQAQNGSSTEMLEDYATDRCKLLDSLMSEASQEAVQTELVI